MPAMMTETPLGMPPDFISHSFSNPVNNRYIARKGTKNGSSEKDVDRMMDLYSYQQKIDNMGKDANNYGNIGFGAPSMNVKSYFESVMTPKTIAGAKLLK